MSDLIQLLPDHIANQIAAGEVVQRPASVVKELMENSIDAGATSIKLVVKDAGRTLVQVIDDGSGMSETDARMCFERHATSKIRKAEDLFLIKTMGFRGEAMASIAAVAQVEMRTRRPQDTLGIQLNIEASEIKLQEPCQTPVGTSISVKNLFYNVPARRNFLKSNPIEMRHILDEFQRVALAHPNIFFTLHHNGVELFHLPKGNLRQRIVGVLGQAANKKIVPVEQNTDVLNLNGFIGRPDFAKKTRGEQFFFVNNRFIRSSYLHHAVMNAYEGLLPDETHPFYVIFLEIDPAKIDVNVHPTKHEIKFDDERLVYNYLRVSVRHSLGQYSVMPELDFEQEGGMAKHIEAAANSLIRKDSPMVNPSNNNFSFGSNHSTRRTTEDDNRHQRNLDNWQKLYNDTDTFKSKISDDEDTEEEPFETFSSKSNTPDAEAEFALMPSLDEDLFTTSSDGIHKSEGKGLYQLHSTYIVAPIKSGMMLIDQQSAHERILYERYLKILERQQPVIQQLLFPVALRLTPADAALIGEILPEINALGIDLRADDADNGLYSVHGLPPEFKIGQEETIIETLLEQFKRDTDFTLKAYDRLARSLARSAAVKRGQELPQGEMQELLDKLFACEQPFKAPGGRKTFITLGLDELDNRF